MPEGSPALCYAVRARDGDLRVGYRDYNCGWYRPVDEAELAKLCTDISGKCHGTSKRVAILAAKGGRLLNPSAPSGSLTPQEMETLLHPRFDDASRQGALTRDEAGWRLLPI